MESTWLVQVKIKPPSFGESAYVSYSVLDITLGALIEFLFHLFFSSSQTEKDPSKREYSTAHILRDHPYAVGCVAWSPDDSILLTAADPVIKLWNVKVCICMCVIYVLLTLPSDWGVHEVSRCPHRCSNSARVAARRFRIHFRWTGPKNYLMGRQRHSLRNSIFP